MLGPTRWTDVGKPTIAAVNGVAYAGGLEWACWTDMAIADAHATFGVTCRRWNIGLADGGTQRLPRIVGFRRAMELIVTGRVIDADEALRIGLVNEVVAERDLPRAGDRAGRDHRRAAPAGAPHRPRGGDPRLRTPARRGPDESRPSASTARSPTRRRSRGCGSSTSATTRPPARLRHYSARRQSWPTSSGPKRVWWNSRRARSRPARRSVARGQSTSMVQSTSSW